MLLLYLGDGHTYARDASCTGSAGLLVLAQRFGSHGELEIELVRELGVNLQCEYRRCPR